MSCLIALVGIYFSVSRLPSLHWLLPQAAWRLGRWDTLSDLVVAAASDREPSFDVDVARLLLNLRSGSQEGFNSALASARLRVCPRGCRPDTFKTGEGGVCVWAVALEFR